MNGRLVVVACLIWIFGWSVADVSQGAEPGLVGFWRLDETSGTTALDEAGGDNNGTLGGTGLTWQPADGRFGGALEYTAASSYVEFSTTGMSASAGTVALWAHLAASQSTDTRYLFGHSTLPLWSNRIQLYMDGGNTNLDLGLGSSHTAATDLATLETEKWYHIAFTWNAGAFAVYIDGQTIRTGSYSGLDTLQTFADFGNNGGDRTQVYFGRLDEVMLYNRALTLAEVQRIMQGTNPGRAAAPSPHDEATDVLRETMLGWEAGKFASAHDVYLGTLAVDVNNADRANPLGVLVSQGQDANSYDPPVRLELGRTYYWRIDEVNAAPDHTIYKGDIWRFTVEPYSYALTGIKATASSVHNATTGPEKTIDGSGIDPNTDQHSTNSYDMWLSNKKGVQPTWIQYEFPAVCKLDKMLVWNSNQTTEATVGFGAMGVTIQYSLDGTTWTALGDYEFAQAPGEPFCTADTTIDFAGVAVKFVKLTINSNWGGLLKQYGLAEVRFLYIPVSAREPSPADGATNVHPQVALSWRAGRESASHEVYLGTDPNALALAATTATAGYDVATDLLKTYYWKVVEVNNAETSARWEGDVWSFSTAEFVTVDDFESYTNDSPSRLFQIWIDGAGFSSDEYYPTGNNGNGSGALVGYDPTAGDVMETSLIHGGKQSMPLYYDNSSGVRYSEAERTFSPAQDWTQHTITSLVIWFRGDPNNVAAPLYAKINGTKIVYNNGVASTALPLWKQWTIPLSSLSGVNLKSVKTLAIGVGDGKAGGTGTIFIDDIRLYNAAPQVVAPANPGTTGLTLLYAMEGDVKDTSGKNNNGTANGEPLYVQGMAGMGKALAFDGLNDYIDMPIGTVLSTMTNGTFAVWVRNLGTTAWGRIMDCGTGTTVYMFLTADNSYERSPRFALTTTGNGAGAESVVSGPRPIGNGWHHLAVTIDASSMTLRLYVDGELADSATAQKLPKDMGVTTNNWLGRSQWTADPFLTGVVDDLRIYNRTLSEAEIRYLAGDR